MSTAAKSAIGARVEEREVLHQVAPVRGHAARRQPPLEPQVVEIGVQDLLTPLHARVLAGGPVSLVQPRSRASRSAPRTERADPGQPGDRLRRRAPERLEAAEVPQKQLRAASARSPEAGSRAERVWPLLRSLRW